MKRGEIWSVAAAGYAGKRRPAVIVQSDKFDATDSITVCLFTTDAADAPYVRLQLAPTEQNGLHSISRLMVDKIVTIHKRKVGKRLGLLDRADVLRLDHRAIMVFLGLA
jgi:mRNA interferase MazF